MAEKTELEKIIGNNRATIIYNYFNSSESLWKLNVNQKH
jgi:hypothetical protein